MLLICTCFQILSTSGESGFFEGSSGGGGEATFTDLHAFLESDPNNVPIDSRDQQASKVSFTFYGAGGPLVA